MCLGFQCVVVARSLFGSHVERRTSAVSQDSLWYELTRRWATTENDLELALGFRAYRFGCILFLVSLCCAPVVGFSRLGVVQYWQPLAVLRLRIPLPGSTGSRAVHRGKHSRAGHPRKTKPEKLEKRKTLNPQPQTNLGPKPLKCSNKSPINPKEPLVLSHSFRGLPIPVSTWIWLEPSKAPY